MTHRFKVGDRVMLKKSTDLYLARFTSGPGRIILTDYHDWLDYKVRWDTPDHMLWVNGSRDLTPASVIYSEDYLKEKDIL